MQISKSNSGKRRIILPYNPALKELARKLRKNMTVSEKLLWNELKGKKISGFDFDRQRPIDNYIVDFYCKDLMLAIEIDGIVHDNEEAKAKDKARQEKLESLGMRFLRFKDEDVKTDLSEVVKAITNWVEQHKNDQPGIITHPPTPACKYAFQNSMASGQAGPPRRGSSSRIKFPPPWRGTKGVGRIDITKIETFFPFLDGVRGGSPIQHKHCNNLPLLGGLPVGMHFTL